MESSKVILTQNSENLWTVKTVVEEEPSSEMTDDTKIEENGKTTPQTMEEILSLMVKHFAEYAEAEMKLSSTNQADDVEAVKKPTDEENRTQQPPNDKVLEWTMSYLSLKYLLTCRQVCKSWMIAAAPQVAKTSMVCFDEEDQETGSITGIRNFLQDMTFIMTEEYPPFVQRIQLIDVDWRQPGLITFFQIYGQYIRELRIEITPFAHRSRSLAKKSKRIHEWQGEIESQKIEKFNIEHLRNLLLFYVKDLEYLELMNLPLALRNDILFEDLSSLNLPESKKQLCNLKRLRVKPDGGKPRRWDLVTDIISISDKLEEIHLGESVKAAPVLNTLKSRGGFIKIKRLILNSLEPMDIRLLNDASEKGELQLQYFQFSLSEISIQLAQEYKSAVHSFLCHNKECLQALRINEDFEVPLGIHLPRMMKKLKELKLVPVHCSLSFLLASCPALEKLSLFYASIIFDQDQEKIDELFMPSTCYFYLVTCLELPYALNSAYALIKFRNHFPNVTTLITRGISNPIFVKELWITWPRLLSLTLELEVDLEETADLIFTGLNPEEIGNPKAMIHKIKQLLQMTNAPSILNLKELSYLEVTLGKDLRGKKYSFTNITGYFGLIHLANLKTLLFPASHIDEECINTIENHLQLDEVDFEHIHSGSSWWKY